MTSNLLTRRQLSVHFLSTFTAIGLITRASALTATVASPADNEISRTCECIHQEVVFKASRARVYQALTDAKQFSKVTDFSIPGASTTISPEVGGVFSLFGGVISGRHIEMVPNERLVQAWRRLGAGRLLDRKIPTERCRSRHQHRLRPHRIPTRQSRKPGRRMEVSLLEPSAEISGVRVGQNC